MGQCLVCYCGYTLLIYHYLVCNNSNTQWISNSVCYNSNTQGNSSQYVITVILNGLVLIML